MSTKTFNAPVLYDLAHHAQSVSRGDRSVPAAGQITGAERELAHRLDERDDARQSRDVDVLDRRLVVEELVLVFATVRLLERLDVERVVPAVVGLLSLLLFF